MFMLIPQFLLLWQTYLLFISIISCRNYGANRAVLVHFCVCYLTQVLPAPVSPSKSILLIMIIGLYNLEWLFLIYRKHATDFTSDLNNGEPFWFPPVSGYMQKMWLISHLGWTSMEPTPCERDVRHVYPRPKVANNIRNYLNKLCF